MRALSIRQPFAELVLRGIKTIEYRSRPTRIIGERFLIYASRSPAKRSWSSDLAMPHAGELPDWMLELAEQMKMIPTGSEHPFNSTGKAGGAQDGGAESGALGIKRDRELAEVVKSWRSLPADVRATILALARGAN